MKKQKGYFLLVAIMFILVMGMMGSVMVYLTAMQSNLSANSINGLKTFYNAESALDIATHYLYLETLTQAPMRLSCDAINDYAQYAPALNGGTIVVTTLNNSPIFARSTISSTITAAVTTIAVASTTGFAPNGRVTIDREAIDYTGISGNSFIGITRGAGGTLASSHTSGAGVGQYQCSLNAVAGIPSVAAADYKRQLQQDVQLQNGYAVGQYNVNNQTIVNWNKIGELTWSDNSLAATSTTRAIYHGISMVSGVDGWAVGDRITAGFSLMRWNGLVWTMNTLAGACTGQDLYGVSMVSSIQGFAVGLRYRAACATSGNYRYSVLYWNGTAWSLLTPTTSPSIPADAAANANLRAVHVIDTNGDGRADTGFAVGDSGVILRYNGTNWIVISSSTTTNLSGVYTVSASEAWAVGASGLILRYNGSTWSTFTSGVTDALNSISMLDTDGDGLANFGVIAGDSGKILTYNGSSWSSVDLGTTNFEAADIFDAKDAWVVGLAGSIYHYENSNWVAYTSPTAQPLYGISLVRPGTPVQSTWRQIFG